VKKNGGRINNHQALTGYAPVIGSGFYPVIRNGIENAGSNPVWGASVIDIEKRING
jgi:hypothetical protein